MLRSLVTIGFLLAPPVYADTSILTMDQDLYRSGRIVTFDGPQSLDLFLAGSHVTVAAPAGRSADLAGRRVIVLAIGTLVASALPTG